MIVEARHDTGLRFTLHAGKHVLVSDQRPEYGGQDAGPMPSELFLSSVASCFGASVAHVARKMRVELPALRVEVDGHKHADAARFERVAVTVEARCERPRLERMVQLARKVCFVTNSISSDVELRFESRVLP